MTSKNQVIVAVLWELSSAQWANYGSS